MLKRGWTTWVLAAFVVGMYAGPVHAGPGPSNLSCAPNVENAIAGDHGPTDIHAHGATHFAHAYQGSTDLGAGDLTWNMTGQITGANTGPGDGDLFGTLSFTIDWSASRPNTSFSSTCIARLETHTGFVADADYQGILQGYPVVSTIAQGVSSTTGFAHLDLERQHPKVADLFLLFEPGGRCQKTTSQTTITRNNAQALGSKHHNGGRTTLCVS